jgi:hypothetical protein
MTNPTDRFLAILSLSLAVLGCNGKQETSLVEAPSANTPSANNLESIIASTELEEAGEIDVRLAARKVFELGGSVNVVADGKEYNHIKSLEAIPQTDLLLTYVGLWHLPNVTDEDIKFLSGLPDLVGIGLDSTGITDIGLESYYGLKKVIRIEIGGTKVTEKGVKELLTKHPEITDVIINDLPITDNIMHLIGRRGFIWAQRTKISDTGLAFFAGKEIHTLRLDGTAITDEGLKNFAGTSIYDLSLADTSITDTGLSNLSSMKRIDVLYLKGTAVTQDGIAAFQKSFPNCKVGQ